MKISVFQLDSFSSRVFSGNPAAVCPLEEWIDDDLQQRIATENAVSETAFLVPEGDGYRLRWFTPEVEVDLCGHATLAAAWVVLNELDQNKKQVTFETRGGRLTVRTGWGGKLVMDFPVREAVPRNASRALVEGLGHEPVEVLASERDYLAIFDSEDSIERMRPDMARLRALDRLGIIVSAPGDTADFVSRFFAPSVGVPEDPATGSAHCTLAPYWAGRLAKGDSIMEARQLSKRGGRLLCRHLGTRVAIAGDVTPYLRGEISV